MPYFVVFYNGLEQAPEQYELRLSDAFEWQVDNPQIELICKVYNINARRRLLHRARRTKSWHVHGCVSEGDGGDRIIHAGIKSKKTGISYPDSGLSSQ